MSDGETDLALSKKQKDIITSKKEKVVILIFVFHNSLLWHIFFIRLSYLASSILICNFSMNCSIITLDSSISLESKIYI